MLLKEKVPLKYTFGKIRFEIAFVLTYSTLVWILKTMFDFEHITIPLSIPAILGTVISLLLGFKSNQAYDRWWEARQVWGAIVNDSRSLARQVQCFAEKEFQEEVVERFRADFIHRQIAWCFSLGQNLRGINPLQGLDKHMSREDIARLDNFSNVPAAILNMHGRDLNIMLNEGWVNRFQQIEMERTLVRLCDAQGKCERIKNTVFPVTYSMYIHFSLLLFIALLPFGLVDYLGVLAIPAVAAIASCFLLIEKMAIHLQDPFDNKPTDTPVTTIAKNIEKDLTQMINSHVSTDIVSSAKVQDQQYFYIM